MQHLNCKLIHTRHRGSSLLEILVAIVLLAVLIPALMAGFTAAHVGVKDARMLELAKHIAQLKLEQALSHSSVEPQPPTPFPGFPGFVTSVSTKPIWESSALEVTVVVRYRFLTGNREYKMVSIHYGG